jgi:molybdenum cofactor guanylyltransferase
MTEKLTGCAAAIMAGGQATRLGGIAKGLLEIDGRPILERQLQLLRALFDEVFLVANETAPYLRFGVPIVPDRVTGCGPLGGLEAALAFAQAPRVFLCACDMPGLRAEAIRLVVEGHDDADVVVPIVGGLAEPLHARYGKTCLPAIQRSIAARQFKMTDLFSGLKVAGVEETTLRAIDAELGFLRNVNTRADAENLSASLPRA